MNSYLSTNSLIDAIGTRPCYIKKSQLRNWTDNGFRYFSTLTRFFLDLFMFHRRYSNCRPENSAPYNPIICQTVENTSFLERLSYILHAFAKDYQGYTCTNPISDFKFLSTAKSGKSRTENPFLDSPKGTHPYLASLLILRRSFYTRWRILLTTGLFDRIPPWSTPWH